MSERKYSVSEINALRSAAETLLLWGTLNQSARNGQMSRGFRPEEKATAVEEMVRTYMMAGVTADDLYADERETK